jgi:hypothetical protein
VKLDARAKVHVLMGGYTRSDCRFEPESEVELFGANGVVLSEALKRGKILVP